METAEFKAVMKAHFSSTEPQAQEPGSLPVDGFGKTEFTFALL